MKKVALYVRVSTEEQAQEGFSIEAQINTLTDYCDRNNYKVARVYKDEGISAKSLERPDLQEMLEASQTGYFDLVVVWKISRLSRTLKDCLDVIDQLEKNNVGFISVSENVDVTTPTGKAMLQMIGTFAELERNVTVENVKLGMTQRAKEGKWNGGTILGYTSFDKKLSIVEEEAVIVRRIFELYLLGHGYKAITNRLNHEGYRTKKGNNFSINAVQRIILNPTYVGMIRFNSLQDWSQKRRKGKNDNPLIVKGDHEAIIDLETWEKAQAIYERRSHQPIKKYEGHFPLTGLLKCPTCGGSMISHKIRNSKKSNVYTRYYQCSVFHQKGSAVCRSNLLKADYAEQEVFNRLEQIVSDPQILQSIVENVNGKIQTQKQPLLDQLTNINKEIRKVKKNAEALIKFIEQGQAPDLVRERLQAQQDDLNSLLEIKAEIERELSLPTIEEISYDYLRLALVNFANVLPKASPVQQKDLLSTIIKRITINASEDINQRTIQHVELYFDTTQRNYHVPTYDTVHRA